MRRSSVLLLLGLSLTLQILACDGCGPRPGAGSAPRFISSDDEVVLVGRTSVVADVYDRWEAVWATVFTPSQREQARRELALTVGVDPLDVDALRETGLDPKQPWAAGWAAERDHWIVALPALDERKLHDAIVDWSRRRYGAEARVAGDVTRLVAAFGPEEVERAAVGRRDGVVLWVIGRDAARVLGGLRSHPAPESASSLYDDTADLRGRIDIDGPTLSKWARRGGFRDAERLARLLASWSDRLDFSTRFSEDGLGLQGDFHMTDAGRRALAKAQPDDDVELEAVRAIAVPDAFVALVGALSPQMVFDVLMPEGSDVRNALDEAREDGRLVFDIEKEIVPALSGGFALSAGAGDLSGFEFKELVGAPQKALWTAFAVGRDPSQPSPYGRILQSARDAPSVDVRTRMLSEQAIHSFTSGGTLLTEVTELEHAWVGANEPAVMNRILTRGSTDASPPPLFELQARFSALQESLRTFRAGSLPIFVRATWAQILDAVALLGDLKLRATAESEGLRTTLDLGLQAPEPPSAAASDAP